MPQLNFILAGRDQLSHVLDQAGDASNRLHRRLTAMSINSDAAVRRFTNNASRNLAGLQRDTDAGGKALEQLKKATLLLAPAAIPAAASLAPIAAGAGAVAVALGTMGAALGPQISKLGDAAEAHKKYEDAVDKSGAASEEAVTAQLEYQRLIAKMPPETRRAAAAVAVLKDEYQAWSDSLAGDTMAPFTKGVAIANALLPKTRALVKGTAAETDRFMTILGGEMASPGFDRMATKFEQFANGTLRRLNDGFVHLLRTTDSGEIGSDAREFMDWARAQGPTVASILQSVGTALMNVLRAGGEVGVGLLQAVQVFARLVAAVPPGAIAVFLQLAVALKLTKVAALGLVAARTALAAFGVQLVAMQTAAAAAPGRLAAVTAAIGAMSRGAKIALAGTGIGLLILGLAQLSQIGKSAPPNVDRLTTSLGELARTGKVSGEAARAFGADLGGLGDSLRTLARPSNLDATQQFLTRLVGMDSTPVKKAKEDLDGVDKALANLVQSGKADLAKAAFDRVAAAMRKQGMTTGELRKQLGDYRSALADQKFEAELAAQSQGLFGAQAQKTQAALAAQKQSADGLRQSIQALNDVNRQGLGGMIGFEAAVDAAAKAARDNAGALSMSGGQLNLNSEKARTAATALNDLAARTDEATASARQSGASWSTVNGIYERGRAQLIASAQAMGLTKKQAAQLADQILKIPNKTTLLKGDVKDLDAKIDEAQRKVDGLRQKRRTAVGADKSRLDKEIAAAQARVDSLRQKRAVTLSAVDRASATARAIAAAIARIRSKTVTLKTVQQTINIEATVSRSAKNLAGYAGGGKPKPGELAWVGEEGPELVRFGSGAQVFDHRTSMAMGARIEGAGRDAGAGLAVGMASSIGGVGSAARVMAAAVTSGIRTELQISSPSKKTKALAKDVAKGFIEGLTGSRDKIKATAADLAKDIKTAFSGRKESGLLRMLKEVTFKNSNLAETRDWVAAKIKAAREYASTLTTNARQGAGLSNLGMGEGEVTAGGIKGGLAAKLTQIRRFAAYVKELAQRGLNKGLLRQILDMGPEQGYAYASALAGADKSTFSQINSLQKRIDTDSTSLGRIGADRMYDAGRNAGKGFLEGLKSSQKRIEDLMLKIAKAMQRAIKRSLGIRSPSTVMARLGAYSTEGLARGLTDGMPVLDSALVAVSGRVAATQPVLGRPAITGSGGGTVVHIHVDGTVMDEHAVAMRIQKTLLGLKRHKGGAALGLT